MYTDIQQSIQITWTVLLKGSRNNPHLFGKVLVNMTYLPFVLSSQLKYVNKLFLYSPSLFETQSDKASFPNFLSSRSYQITISKAQLSFPHVILDSLSSNPQKSHFRLPCMSLLLISTLNNPSSHFVLTNISLNLFRKYSNPFHQASLINELITYISVYYGFLRQGFAV